MRSSRSSSTAASQPKLTPPKLVPPCRASSVAPPGKATSPSPHQGTEPSRSRAVRRPGRTTAATHQRRTAARRDYPRPAPWCRAVTNSGVSPRNWGCGNMLSYAEFARSPLSEERRQADPPAGLSLFNHTRRAQPGGTQAPALRQRFRHVAAETAKGSAPNWCGALTMCAPGGKRSGHVPELGRQRRGLAQGKRSGPSPAPNRGCAQPPFTQGERAHRR